MPSNLGEKDDDPTRPDTPTALRARSGEQLVSCAQSIAHAIGLLDLLEESEREYFCGRLAEDIEEFAAGARDLANAVRFAGTEVTPTKGP
jgi:hypothetical protein